MSPMTGPLSATASSIPIEDIKQWRGQDVLDPADEKLGKLEEVFYDTETDTPAFAAVKSGVFGKHLTLVTVAGATAGISYLRVAVDKSAFKGAPSFDPEAELTIDDEAEAYRYFGVGYRPAAEGARRLAKH
jgi:hypothetical protein